MAYVNVKDWTVDQVTDWLKGLDNVISIYANSFVNNMVTGRQLLNFRSDDLENLNVKCLGHQEIILEAVELLRNFHYELDKENLQSLALKLSCAARSVFKELLIVDDDGEGVPTQILSDVHTIISAIKPLTCWMDRAPFTGDKEYSEKRTQLLQLGFEIATCAHRDNFTHKPVQTIRAICEKLFLIADNIIQFTSDPMILQPASLDLATLKKKEQEWGFYILPSNHAIHQIADIKYGSPAHGTSKIEEGDEVVQVNYQTVVGWQRKKVMILLQESPPEIVLTLKKRPRHTKVYGQIYMKPYRLPSRKRDGNSWFRWKDNLPSPRLLDLAPITIPKLACVTEPEDVENSSGSNSDSEPPDSPLDGGGRIYPHKPRQILQRRNTITGATPTSKRPEFFSEEYWFKPKTHKTTGHSSTYNIDQKDFEGDSKFLRDKSASCNTGLDLSPRPTTVIGLTGNRSSFKKTTKDKPATKKRVNFDEKKLSPKAAEPVDDSNLNDEKSVSVNSLASLTNEEIGFIDEGRELTDRTSMTENQETSDRSVKDPTLADVNIHNIIKKFDEQKQDSQQKLVKPKILPRFQSKKPPEVPQKPDTIKKPLEKPQVPPRSATTKIRGRLDKSHSTPAYDLTGEEKPQFIIDKGKVAEKLPDLIPDVQKVIPFTETVYELGIPLVSPIEICKEDDVPPKPPPRTFGVEISKPAYPADSPKPANLVELTKCQTNNRVEVVPKQVFDFSDAKIQEKLIETVKEEKTPKFFEPKVASTPTTKTKMDFSDTESYKPSPTITSMYEMQKSTSDSKVSPTNSIVKGLMTGKNKTKKKNSLINKRRKVTVNDLSPSDIQGMLHQRLRNKHNQNVHWEKRYFVLLGNCLYGFKNKEEPRAACLIFLSGFTVAVASEVKSRSNAFKVYHTGTVFYFSVDDPDTLQSWIDLIRSATIHNDPSRNTENSLYSETDDSDSEKLKSPSANAEKPDTFKKFGSLKKFSSNKSKDPSTASGSTSLDRKWFFNKSSGHSKNSLPVPTAQFRSYRKMRAPDVNASVTTGNFTSHVPIFGSSNNLAQNQAQNVSVPNLSVDNSTKTTDINNDIQKTKPYNYVHSSNPSLCNISEFNVPNFKKKPPTKQYNENLAGFVTLEELMNRQTEERKLNPHHIVEEMANNLKLIKPDVVYGEVPIRPKEHEERTDNVKISHSRSSSGSTKSCDAKHETTSSCFGKRLGSLKKVHKEEEFDSRMSTYPKAAKGFEHKMNRSLPRTHKMQEHYRNFTEPTIQQYISDKNLARNYPERPYEMIHCQETVNDVHFAQNRTLDDRMYQESPKKSSKLKKQHSFSKSSGNKVSDSSSSKIKLKSAIHYTPISLPLGQDTKSKPKFAFELNLDEKSTKSGKIKQMFGSKSESKKEKTFLGSPTLRKALFKSPSSGNEVNWATNVATHELPIMSSSYTMESSPQAASEPFAINVSPPVDYPGMEYPPVFEPETYSLADPQSSLSILRKQGKNRPQ